MNPPLLRVEGLAKRFGALAVTDDVSFSVDEGRLVALIGPNGAGKTTLIDQLSGALQSDAGRIHFRGLDISALDVAIAKAKASETACTATAECLQMHGGIGMTDEFDIGLFLKRARVDAVLFGDAAFHADRVATMLGY